MGKKGGNYRSRIAEGRAELRLFLESCIFCAPARVAGRFPGLHVSRFKPSSSLRRVWFAIQWWPVWWVRVGGWRYWGGWRGSDRGRKHPAGAEPSALPSSPVTCEPVSLGLCVLLCDLG